MTFQLGNGALVGFVSAKKTMKGIPNMTESMETHPHVLLGQEGSEGNEGGDFGMVPGTRITECGR